MKEYERNLLDAVKGGEVVGVTLTLESFNEMAVFRDSGREMFAAVEHDYKVVITALKNAPADRDWDVVVKIGAELEEALVVAQKFAR